MTFGRTTLIHLVDELVGRAQTHAALDTLLIRFGLEDVAPASLGGLEKRGAKLLKHLVNNPDASGPVGEGITFQLAEHVLDQASQKLTRGYYRDRTLSDECPELVNSLRQDGFEIEGSKLVRALPEELGLPESRDEVHRLLDHFGFAISKGHLDQCISAHARGQWASANANLRTFFESLLDDFAHHLWPQEATGRNSHGRRELLAQGNAGAQPFLITSLNEWVIGSRGGFIRGAFERLHPEGSHPGLSDEEDSTFRLHLILLTSRHLLRRLERRPS